MQGLLEQDVYDIEILGAYGTRAKDCATSTILLNSKNAIDAGNLIVPLEERCIELENIWITHAHLDHIVDIAALIDSYFNVRKKPLNILALPETIEAIKNHFLNDVIWPDFSKIRLAKSECMAVTYTKVEYDKLYEISDYESVRAIKTDHTVPSCGYIYTKKDTSVLITQDTYSLENIIKMIDTHESINALVVECSFSNDMQELAQVSKHLTPKILFQQLQKLKRDNIKLYINHIKPAYLDKVVDEIEEFRGKWKPILLKDGDFVSF